MTSSRLLEDILAQPESLSRVLAHQTGDGLASLRNAAAMLRSATRVVITGMGASFYASYPLDYLLCSLGIDSVAVEAAELLHYRQSMCKDAVVVLVSRSGESVEIEKLLHNLGGTPTIGVTNVPESVLAKRSRQMLLVGSLPDEMVAIQSYTGTVLALLLLGALVEGSFDEVRARAEALLPALPEFIRGYCGGRSQWDSLLATAEPVHLLGRGPSCASVSEGALLFAETSKSPAVGLPAGSFRHGPVEAVDEKFVGLVFAAQGKTRDLNLGLASDLHRFGGQVRVIGPAKADTNLQFWETPDLPESLAPLLEIIPVQVAALRRAELRGLKVGEFRFAPLVTRDETVFAR